MAVKKRLATSLRCLRVESVSMGEFSVRENVVFLSKWHSYRCLQRWRRDNTGRQRVSLVLMMIISILKKERKKERLRKCQSSSPFEHQIENVIIVGSSALSFFPSSDDARSSRMLFDSVVQRRIDFDSSLICTSTDAEREERNRISVAGSSSKDNWVAFLFFC